jgi:hypothetical protein
MLKVMERKRHGPLKGRSSIFETKRHLTIRECTPWTDECHFVLVFGFDLYLVVSRKTVHEREGLKISTFINYLVDEWCGKIIFWTGLVQIMEVCTYMNRALFLIDRHTI